MNAHAILVVNDHIQVLLDEAAAQRRFHANQPTIVKRIVSAASSVKAAISAPADYSQSILPTLDDYPYRS